MSGHILSMHATTTYISVMFGNAGNRSPVNLNWLLDKLNHSSAIKPVSSINGNVCNKFSCKNSHFIDVSPLNMPDGMVSRRFRRKNNCSKCCCEWNSRAGNIDMSFSPKSLCQTKRKEKNRGNENNNITNQLIWVGESDFGVFTLLITHMEGGHGIWYRCRPYIWFSLASEWHAEHDIPLLIYHLPLRKYLTESNEILWEMRVWVCVLGTWNNLIKIHSDEAVSIAWTAWSKLPKNQTVLHPQTTSSNKRKKSSRKKTVTHKDREKEKDNTYSLWVKFKPFNESSVNWILFPSRYNIVTWNRMYTIKSVLLLILFLHTWMRHTVPAVAVLALVWDSMRHRVNQCQANRNNRRETAAMLQISVIQIIYYFPHAHTHCRCASVPALTYSWHLDRHIVKYSQQKLILSVDEFTIDSMKSVLP